MCMHFSQILSLLGPEESLRSITPPFTTTTVTKVVDPNDPIHDPTSQFTLLEDESYLHEGMPTSILIRSSLDLSLAQRPLQNPSKLS